jgi:hypothetical protein
MHKLSIFGVKINNLLNFDLILNEPPPYFEFSSIKNIIQQYDFIVLLDNEIHNKQKIIESIDFLIKNDYDQLLLDNSQQNSLEIMEYEYYKRIVKSNRIFKNLTKEDIKQKNIPNNYKPLQCILQPSIIRTQKFILPNFFLKINPHIENLYSSKLINNGFNIASIKQSFILTNNNSPKVIKNNQSENNLTIITGFLNIKIKRPSKRDTIAQNYDYIEKSRDTLQIPQYMVIYCSEDIIHDVTKIREGAGLLKKTKIIEITLENNLYMIDKLDIIRENVAKNNPPYDIPEYILAVNSRYSYIQNAIENNYFQTDYFAWVDFSASHIVNIPPNKIIEPKSIDRIRIGWIARYSNNQFVYNHYCLGGGIFSGHKEIMMELIKLHHSEFAKLTDMGYNINDDKLLFIIKEQYPYLFDTYFSDYKNLFIKL